MPEMDKTPRFPPRKLRVVIRDTSLVVLLGEPVQHRSVEITLTDDQLRKLELRWTGHGCGVDMYEEVSSVFFDDDHDA